MTPIQEFKMVRIHKNRRKLSHETGPFGHKLVHHDVLRTDGIGGIDNQLVVIHIPTRLSIHLFAEAGQTLGWLVL